MKKMTMSGRATANILYAVAIFLVFYLVASWKVFQWRNPKANDIVFYQNFVEVVTWQQMEKYQ